MSAEAWTVASEWRARIAAAEVIAERRAETGVVLEGRIVELTEGLRRLEWGGFWGHACPACRRPGLKVDEEHASDCWLAALLPDQPVEEPDR